jgi:hypothetical protein
MKYKQKAMKYKLERDELWKGVEKVKEEIG